MSAPSFAFGSTVWPGLAKLIEEAGEVQQVAGKLMMTGGLSEHWDGSDLRERLTDEIADLRAAIRFVIVFNGLDAADIALREEEKMIRFEGWHEKAAERDPIAAWLAAATVASGPATTIYELHDSYRAYAKEADLPKQSLRAIGRSLYDRGLAPTPVRTLFSRSLTKHWPLTLVDAA